ncbi:hypothetical protein JMJ56_31585 [Belnapia sp. T18]|uniref:Uncharacterized protein n=1 Tax=Belnapia arida TaxID=2804533 RepID=A0ABS1UEC9_9PROT|nr:hypothetical protein [Belnapia arida]MBL6082510.1 hypothetical protein [Belnapia arida]
MFNPWTKKNPLRSMMLSGANAWAGAARGIMTGQAKRQQTAAMREGTTQVTDVWAAALTSPTPEKRARKKQS